MIVKTSLRTLLNNIPLTSLPSRQQRQHQHSAFLHGLLSTSEHFTFCETRSASAEIGQKGTLISADKEEPRSAPRSSLPTFSVRFRNSRPGAAAIQANNQNHNIGAQSSYGFQIGGQQSAMNFASTPKLGSDRGTFLLGAGVRGDLQCGQEESRMVQQGGPGRRSRSWWHTSARSSTSHHYTTPRPDTSRLQTRGSGTF